MGSPNNPSSSLAGHVNRNLQSSWLDLINLKFSSIIFVTRTDRSLLLLFLFLWILLLNSKISLIISVYSWPYFQRKFAKTTKISKKFLFVILLNPNWIVRNKIGFKRANTGPCLFTVVRLKINGKFRLVPCVVVCNRGNYGQPILKHKNQLLQAVLGIRNRMMCE